MNTNKQDQQPHGAPEPETQAPQPAEVPNNPVETSPPGIDDSPMDTEDGALMAPDIFPAAYNVGEHADCEEMPPEVRWGEPLPGTCNNEVPSLQPPYCSENVEVSCNVNWGDGWASMQRQLENRLKERVAWLELRGQTFYLQRPRRGEGGGAQYKYILMQDHIKLRLTADKVGQKGRENVQILIDGVTCLPWTLEQAYQKALGFITQLGGKVLSEVASRIDIRLDLAGQGMQPFEQAFDARNYVTELLARNKMESCTGHATLYMGRQPLQVRIYDIIGEARDKNDKCTRHEIEMLERVWGSLPETATRVEFRLWRTALRDRGINTIQDYLAMRADLVHDLTHKVIRFINGPVDARDAARTLTLPLWEDVQSGLQMWAGAPWKEPF